MVAGGRLRSPQEKKELSYAKDRRNGYGGNDKSFRRNIPRSKRVPHRADQHRAHQILAQAAGATGADLAERSERRLAHARPTRVTGFRKSPDEPLRRHVER